MVAWNSVGKSMAHFEWESTVYFVLFTCSTLSELLCRSMGQNLQNQYTSLVILQKGATRVVNNVGYCEHNNTLFFKVHALQLRAPLCSYKWEKYMYFDLWCGVVEWSWLQHEPSKECRQFKKMYKKCLFYFFCLYLISSVFLCYVYILNMSTSLKSVLLLLAVPIAVLFFLGCICTHCKMTNITLGRCFK